MVRSAIPLVPICTPEIPPVLCGPKCLCVECPSRCGDGVCGFEEDNCNCPEDCGKQDICSNCIVLNPPPACGDGVCDGPCVVGGETSRTCPQDCHFNCPL